ncbi:unnamed protein product, partial [Cunninghamella blakesleeana]
MFISVNIIKYLRLYLISALYERPPKIWYDVIKKEDCQKVINSMPSRIQQCIKAKGYWA